MEKKCGYKRSEIWLYIQNRMSREEETKFQQHLLSCEECRNELQQLRLMVRSIGKKEKRGITLRGWMVAASVACILIGGGVYWRYYSGLGGSHLLPDGPHELKINPPVLHHEKDSIAPQDSISADTMQIHVLD